MLRIGKQGRSTTMTIDRWRRTAEVQIDSRGCEPGQLRGVVGETGRVAAKQLHDQRRPGTCATGARELRANADEASLWQEVSRHADELADRQVIAADPRQHIAQYVVEQTLHRCQQQSRHLFPPFRSGLYPVAASAHASRYATAPLSAGAAHTAAAVTAAAADNGPPHGDTRSQQLVPAARLLAIHSHDCAAATVAARMMPDPRSTAALFLLSG
ncbi:MAG: hypothetical protein AW07_03529 [Candidatus Accumulibacter sp. SK-11]|nr:MAG: hypothetical protein AW07_03529 [Candidatus Accumulibacter sp. SK-11]